MLIQMTWSKDCTFHFINNQFLSDQYVRHSSDTIAMTVIKSSREQMLQQSWQFYLKSAAHIGR